MSTLRIYKEGGVWWMDYAGDLTDQLIHDTKGRWVAAFFTQLRGTRCVITDRSSKVMLFVCGHVEYRAISDQGTVALIAFGSGNTPRLELLRADGMAAKLPAEKRLIQATGVDFAEGGEVVEVTLPNGTARYRLNELGWRRGGKSVRTHSIRPAGHLPKWAVWVIFGTVAGFFLMLWVMSL